MAIRRVAATTGVLFDDVVFTDYGQFDLVWSGGIGFDGDWPKHFAGHGNGLVGTAHDSGVYVNLARRSGGSQVRIVLFESEPPAASPYYVDVVEVSIVVPPGNDAGWQSWAGESGGSLDAIDPAAYRVRVSAHGRDAGDAGEFAEGVVDEYVIELWPEAARHDEIVRVGSENAAYWHREIGGRH